MPTATKPAAKKDAKGEKRVSTKVGLVESDKRDRTRQVIVPNLTTHPKYGKIIRRRTVLHVHDEKNTSHVGDLVEVAPCRPMSKTKKWALVRIVRKNASQKFHGIEVPSDKPAEANA